MSLQKLKWFIVPIVFLITSCNQQDTTSQNHYEKTWIQDTLNQKDDETVCRFFRGFNTDVHWETYRITSEEGLWEVDLWVKRHIDYLNYPSQNLQMIASEI